MVKITEVKRHSPAARVGIRKNDTLVAINGHAIEDVLDYRFYLAEEMIILDLLRGEDPYKVTIKKEEYDDIGLGFETPLMDKKQSCRNKCVFCFIDQLPKGMRETLYFKDDDARLSFLHGNYITLTNLSERDAARIIEMHISPVNVSVHTTNPALRVAMMKNPHAGESLAYLSRFAEAGIELHGQIVLCRGLNDGEELERTMRDLEKLYPALSSVSVVPAGLTRHRDGLYPLKPFTKKECAAVLRQVNDFADRCFATHGSRIFFASDEFYLKAGRKLPKEEFYEGYPQIENGVGMLTSFRTEFDMTADLLAKPRRRTRRVSIATGLAAYSLLAELAVEMEKAYPWLSVRVYPIKNKFFGEEITVAGLLTAGDIIEQLRGEKLGDLLLLPSAVLRSEGDLFLDGKTVRDVSRALSVRIQMCGNDGEELRRRILGLKDR